MPFLLQKHGGPSSFVLIGLSPSGETDKDIGEEVGEKRRGICLVLIFFGQLLVELQKSKMGESTEYLNLKCLETYSR